MRVQIDDSMVIQKLYSEIGNDLDYEDCIKMIAIVKNNISRYDKPDEDMKVIYSMLNNIIEDMLKFTDKLK